jgi:hypothetical protein
VLCFTDIAKHAPFVCFQQCHHVSQQVIEVHCVARVQQRLVVRIHANLQAHKADMTMSLAQPRLCWHS